MKVAIVYDRVNKYGGAERFLETILKIFPDAPIYTLVYSPPKSPWVVGRDVIPTFLNKVPFLKDKHELLAPIAPLSFETLSLEAYDLIISVTSSDAKSVITSPRQTHVCICLTPTRYLWKGLKNYKQDWKMKLLPKFIFEYFRLVDKITSQRPDHYIAISNEVKKRIRRYYQRSSTVIYPPVNNFFINSKIEFSKKDFYLIAGRLVRYKRVDIAIECFNKLNKKLIIVGDGSEIKRLKSISSKNIKFLGKVSDQRLKKLYQQAKALIFPGLEDFGLVPLEAQSQGTPIIAYKAGGVKETVIENKTGVFFKKQTPKSLAMALERFEKLKLNPKDCVKNAKEFSEDNFKKRLFKYLSDLSVC